MTGYLRHIHRLNAFDFRRFRPFVVDGVRYGWVPGAVADALADMADDFTVEPDRIVLKPHLADGAARTAAMARTLEALRAAGLTPPSRNEAYSVVNRFGDTPVMTVDRAAVSTFGFKAYGVHINGYRRTADGLALWIGRRSPHKPVEPDKLDNMIAGGQPHGLSLKENVIKEAEEEASVPRALAERAVPVGVINYAMELPEGSRQDCMFCYDLEVPDDFTPVPNDDELVGFELMPVDKILGIIHDTDDVKFNVNLVILDFALRHGAFDPDTVPEFEGLCTGLRGLKGA